MTEPTNCSNDAVINALADGDPQRALLLAYRTGNDDCDLAHAWRLVQERQVELGGNTQDVPEKPSADPCYRIVKHYLNAAVVPRWRQVLLSCLIALLLFATATFILTLHTGKLITSLRSLSWPTTEAKVLLAFTYEKKWHGQDSEQVADFMNFYFSYQVDGEEYKTGMKNVQYYPALGDIPLKRDDLFKIAYDPNNPAVVIYDRKLYDRFFAIPIGLILLAIAIFLVAVEWSREKDYRRLLQVDEEIRANLVQPSSD